MACRSVPLQWVSADLSLIHDFIESYLGMRVESVDEVEIIRRMTEGIYDHEEFQTEL